MRIEVKQFEVVKITDSKGNIIEAEKLIAINARCWNDYCAIEALLHQCVKRYDYEKGKYYDYFPYRKRFLEIYSSNNFTINISNDINILRTIKAIRENNY
jgi:hypothetical protein